MPQGELAKFLGIRQNALCRYETGRNVPIDIVKKICALAHVHSAWVLLGEGQKYIQTGFVKEAVAEWGSPFTSEEQESIRKLREIFQSTDNATKAAIRQSIDIFHSKLGK